MSHKMRYALLGVLATSLLALSAVLAFAQTTGITVTSVMPSTINPTQGQTAKVSYSVPALARCRIYVRNSAGTEVRGIITYADMPAGTYSTYWNGKSNTGTVVPNGIYTVVIDGQNSSGTKLTPGTGKVTVSAGATTTPGAFTITSITPNPFDPTKQRTTVTYTVPIRADYRMYVKDSAGSEVRSLVNYVGMTAGTKTRSWDGKNSSGSIVPDGTYTVHVEGKDRATGAALTTGKATVAVKCGTTTTNAFKINSITPSTIDPSKGDTTQISYTVPVTATYRVYVNNSSGTEIGTLVSYTSTSAGTKTAAWDGKNSSGSIVAGGAYTVKIDGKDSAGAAITAATGTVTVSTTTPPPPPPPTTGSELGQLVEGAGSANFNWLTDSSTKFGIAFRAPKSGTISQITMQWKTSGSYGGGTRGAYNIELQTNGSGNYASGTAIGRVTNVKPSTAMDGYSDGAFHVALNANITAGQIYHVVITNVDPNPASNWASPNTLMTRIQAWDGTGCRGAVNEGGSWRPWTSNANDWNNGGGNYQNGSHSPLMLTFSDGTNWGDPYYSAMISGGAKFYGSSRAGETIYWDKASTTISRVGVSVGRQGSPGALIYHLEKVGSGDVATGTIATASQVGSVMTWVYATLPSAVTLQQGQTYRLWFESPSSSSSSNCYYQYIVYGESRPAQWLEAGWGGTRSCYIYGSGGSWSNYVNGDLAFSLK